MAQQRNQAPEVKLRCSICLDLLKDPVTIPCGHSYCMSCIKTSWDEEDQRGTYSCPLCRETFYPRPFLVKNTMLAELVEELKPHYGSPTLKKCKRVEVSVKLQENVCSRHGEVMTFFCRTDQQCICILCSMDNHKDHDIVSAAAERTEKQKELGEIWQNIQPKIQDRKKNVKLLQKEMKTINNSADEAVKDSEKIFTDLIRVIEKRSSDLKEQIRSWQKTEVSRVKELQEKLDQEITYMKRKNVELEEVSCSEDHTKFLQTYRSLSILTGSTYSPIPKTDRLWYFKDVIAAVTAARDKMQNILTEKLPLTKLMNRAEYLQYSCQITMDTNTVGPWLVLSDENRKITLDKKAIYPKHPDRFECIPQVLSKEGLTGRCYWEMEISRNAEVAVAYKSTARSGVSTSHVFGRNKKSWVLHCNNNYIFIHDNDYTFISAPKSSRVGVYLDHSAGTLDFFSVSETMTLLHRVQTTFTEPLYAGVYLSSSDGDTVEFGRVVSS